MTPATITVSEINPAVLSPAMRKGLDAAERYTLTRRHGGYSCGPDVRVSLRAAEAMIGMKLARIDHGSRQPVLMLTGAGLHVLAVMRQRKARRADHRKAATAARPSSAAPSGAKARSAGSVRTEE